MIMFMCDFVLIRLTHSGLFPKKIAKPPDFVENGGHLGFGGHFEFCNHENVNTGHIVVILCMSMCAFVLIRHTHFELLPKWIAKIPIFLKNGGHLGLAAILNLAIFKIFMQ